MRNLFLPATLLIVLFVADYLPTIHFSPDSPLYNLYMGTSLIIPISLMGHTLHAIVAQYAVRPTLNIIKE